MGGNASERIFIDFVATLYAAGMRQLGKLMDPETGRIQRDLAAAQGTIELLMVLREKTQGNLNENEKNALESVIANLQMNYADEVERELKEREKQESLDKKKGEEDNKKDVACGETKGADKG